MDNFRIAATNQTPEILFDANEGVYSMTGSCFLANALEFFQPVLGWFNEHVPELTPTTKFVFNLPFFNSAAAKGLLVVCQKIVDANKSGKTFSIAWVVEDNDEFMEEAAETLQELLEFKFEIVRVAS